MKLKFLNTLDLGVHHFEAGDIVELNDQDPIVRDLNDEYYIFIYHGIRFDLHRKSVELIDE